MTSKAPSQEWGVVSTCKEPTPLLIALVAHYLSLGAARFHLFLDEDIPELRAAFEGNERAVITVCDRAYWKSYLGMRPKNIIRRQIENATNVAQSTDLPWLLHIDADEFLWSEAPVSEILGSLPDEKWVIKVATAERTLRKGDRQDDIFDGVFRKSLPDDWGQALHEKLSKPPFMRRGLSGHSAGKCFFRTGKGLIPGIHAPRLPGTKTHELPLLQIDSLLLLHFDGLTKSHWQAKLGRLAHRFLRDEVPKSTRMSLRRQEPMRAAQLEFLTTRENAPEALEQLYADLKTISPDEERQLLAFGLLKEIELKIEDSIRALNLKTEVDLSCKAFDRELGAA